MDEDAPQTDAATPEPQWRPLNRIERRVLGVLVEKAKTTPAQYPLSLNGLASGCNQKSNRYPKMELDTDDVEDALEALRDAGATAEVHGDGRVVKYRHYMKDWLGVDGVELAIMAELLLRGTQTVGELRGRAARMAAGQLPDMGTLRPALASLIEKKLVIALTPAGRGQTVTHGLYTPDELAHEKKKLGSAVSAAPAASPSSAPAPTPAAIAPSASPASANTDSANDGNLANEVAELRDEVARLRKEVEDLWENVGK